MQTISLKTITSIAITSVLVGCSSGNSGGGNDSGTTLPASISQFGSINVEDVNADFSLELSGIFMQFDAPVSTAELNSDIARYNLTVDDCEVYIGEESLYQEGEFGTAFESASSIDPGEVITISGPSGTIGEMQSSGPIFHTGSIEATESTSSGLKADIPGAVFPAFIGISIPDVAPFVLTSDLIQTGPFNNDFDIGSTFTWEPGTDPNLRITFYSALTVGTGAPDDLRIEITCALQDDGTFTLPIEVQNQLLEKGLNEIPMHIGREAFTVHHQDDALLVITRTSGNL